MVTNKLKLMEWLKRSSLMGISQWLSPHLRSVPGYEGALQRYCSITSTKKASLPGRAVGFLFWNEYWSRTPDDRLRIQTLLMGGVSGLEWASHYAEQMDEFPPPRDCVVGDVSWWDALPLFTDLPEFLSGKPTNSVLVIQWGASSGRDIAYFAGKFPTQVFVYTDIDEGLCEAAKTRFGSGNLDFVSAFAT